MKTTLPAILLSLALIGTACVGGSDAGIDAESGSTVTPPASRPTTSVVRTIPEEVTTTAAASTTQTTEDLGAPPEPPWLEQEFELFPVADMERPIALTTRTGGDDLWVAERAGRIRQIQRRLSVDGQDETLRLMNTIVLDIRDKVSTDGEGGLLGLAFSNDGNYLYVNYTNLSGNTVVAEYEMDVINAIPSTERILLTVEQPFPNHNGGQVTVGPDGFLYIGLGDGGSGGDPLGHGQNTDSLLGSILRIDPLDQPDGEPYAIPGDNPFIDGGGLPEIWLYGVRNPWRFSFDSFTDDLWIADVGQNRLEEVTLLPSGSERAGRGDNLGWRNVEGDEGFEGGSPPADHRGPLFVYDHSNGRCSVTGGYVYRGSHIRNLEGIYVFADFCSGELFGLETLDDGRLVVSNLLIDRAPDRLVSFGEGPDGEIYVLELSGRVSRLNRPGSGPTTQIVDSDESIPGGQVDDGVQPGNGETSEEEG